MYTFANIVLYKIYINKNEKKNKKNESPKCINAHYFRWTPMYMDALS